MLLYRRICSAASADGGVQAAVSEMKEIEKLDSSGLSDEFELLSYRGAILTLTRMLYSQGSIDAAPRRAAMFH